MARFARASFLSSLLQHRLQLAVPPESPALYSAQWETLVYETLCVIGQHFPDPGVDPLPVAGLSEKQGALVGDRVDAVWVSAVVC